MANTKEIRKQISSISNTQKITSAMEMVASSKMRKTQDRMEMGRPYANRMLSVIGHLANSNPEYKPVYMSERDVKGIGVIVIGSDKGLCGGLNINLFLPYLWVIYFFFINLVRTSNKIVLLITLIYVVLFSNDFRKTV